MAFTHKIQQHSVKEHTSMQDNVREDEWSLHLASLATDQSLKTFEALFKHFAPLIKGFCQANANYLSNEAAEELVQEVMLKVWQKSGDFDPSRASASTWIFTITRNARIDYLRKNARHETLSSPLESDDIWDQDADHQPLVYLQKNRDETEVSNILQTLPDEQSVCIEKVYMEGKSHSEISTELGLPLGTVKSRVRLGLRKLQAHLPKLRGK